MQSEKAIGYSAFVFGVLIILVTLYMGYGLYNSMMAYARAPPPQPQQQNSTAQSISSAIYSAIGNHLPTSNLFFYFLDILLLFLFASIGYKIAALGIHMNSSIKQPGNSKVVKNGKQA